MLRTLAAQKFTDGCTEESTTFLTAALHYAPAAHRATTAHLLAACNLKLGRVDKSFEYLEIANGFDGDESSSLSRVVKMCAALSLDDESTAHKGSF